MDGLKIRYGPKDSMFKEIWKTGMEELNESTLLPTESKNHESHDKT
jgi:hypothetical protein